MRPNPIHHILMGITITKGAIASVDLCNLTCQHVKICEKLLIKIILTCSVYTWGKALPLKRELSKVGGSSPFKENLSSPFRILRNKSLFFSVCFTLKRTPSCSRLDTGGKVNLGISSLSSIHWYRLGATFRWRNKQLLAKPTTAARCRHIWNKIYKFAQEQECPAVEEDRAASVESPPANQTMKLGSHRHQAPDQKSRPAPFFPAFSPFRVFPQMS